MYIYIYIYIYIYTYKFTSKCHSQIVRLSHLWRGDRQSQETFLTASADKQTRNYQP